jgi:hypothetical protein
MRKVSPIRSLGLKMGGGGGSSLVSSKEVLASLDVSMVDLSLRGPSWVGISPPDMKAVTNDDLTMVTDEFQWGTTLDDVVFPCVD